MIHAEVGDSILVVFKNKAQRPYSIWAQGVEAMDSGRQLQVPATEPGRTCQVPSIFSPLSQHLYLRGHCFHGSTGASKEGSLGPDPAYTVAALSTLSQKPPTPMPQMSHSRGLSATWGPGPWSKL